MNHQPKHAYAVYTPSGQVQLWTIADSYEEAWNRAEQGGPGMIKVYWTRQQLEAQGYTVEPVTVTRR